MEQKSLELFLPHTNSTAFKVVAVADDSLFTELTGFNYFTVVLLEGASGELIAGTSTMHFSGDNLFSFSLYQPFSLRFTRPAEGWMINFHPDFFCLHQHRNEVSCNGILFNNVYDSQQTFLSGEETLLLKSVVHGIAAEMQRDEPADTEVILAYLKILLINGSRIKKEQTSEHGFSQAAMSARSAELIAAIELHFRKLHSPAAYAKLLNVTPGVLNRLSKQAFNKTISSLITERIVVEAKRQLYLTAKPVKLIAFELGFNEEFYFSRFFKANVNVSPQLFRETAGMGKANR